MYIKPGTMNKSVKKKKNNSMSSKIDITHPYTLFQFAVSQGPWDAILCIAVKKLGFYSSDLKNMLEHFHSVSAVNIKFQPTIFKDRLLQFTNITSKTHIVHCSQYCATENDTIS